MIRINPTIRPIDLSTKLQRLWDHSARKLSSISSDFDFSKGSPVFTVKGQYQTQGWTEWTLGFHFGSLILQFDATRDTKFLELGKKGTADHMTSHVTHMGVHDHGFNIISTYGNLTRLALESRFECCEWEHRFYELALKCSAAVQARRWTATRDGGFIHSFNGPHSLFADTIRSLRSLAVGQLLGHRLLTENDESVSLLGRLIQHAELTARYSVYYGEGRDAYDIRGRVAHESIFNLTDGRYRCPSTQQGYSPRTTWTRGLAWIILGFAEQLEFLQVLKDEALVEFGGRAHVEGFMLRAAEAASDFYIASSPSNGIPFWDTGAPGIRLMRAPLEQPADPFNEYEPVDSSAAAIASQGLLRLGQYLNTSGQEEKGARYWQAGLTVVASLLDTPYLSTEESHQGLLLHSVYHHPNGWDHVPPGRRIPCGESSMWGDYHIREVALYLQRILKGDEYLAFWGKLGGKE